MTCTWSDAQPWALIWLADHTGRLSIQILSNEVISAPRRQYISSATWVRTPCSKLATLLLVLSHSCSYPSQLKELLLLSLSKMLLPPQVSSSLPSCLSCRTSRRCAQSGILPTTTHIRIPLQLASNPQHASYFSLLQLFSYGTYEDYTRSCAPHSQIDGLCWSIAVTERKDHYPPLTAVQIAKLKLLTLASFAMQQRVRVESGSWSLLTFPLGSPLRQASIYIGPPLDTCTRRRHYWCDISGYHSWKAWPEATTFSGRMGHGSWSRPRWTSKSTEESTGMVRPSFTYSNLLPTVM